MAARVATEMFDVLCRIARRRRKSLAALVVEGLFFVIQKEQTEGAGPNLGRS